MADGKTCPQCGSENIKYDTRKNELICTDCGFEEQGLTPEEEELF